MSDDQARDEAAYNAALDIYEVTKRIRKFDKALRYALVEIDYIILKTDIDPTNVMLELLQLDKRFSKGAKADMVFLDNQKFQQPNGYVFVGRSVGRKAREEELYGLLFLMRKGVIGKVPDESYANELPDEK